MKTKLLILLSVAMFSFTNAQNPITDSSDWSVTNITEDDELNFPNTIIYGPNDMLWITERRGKRVVKVSPNGGTKATMLNLTGVVHQSGGQDGLMGMAIHPDLYDNINTSNNHVFLAYTYLQSGNRKIRIARYDYNKNTGNLNSSSATTLIDGLDASNDHNSGKLQIGPDLKLYYTIGDQGANQFSNACNEIRAQYLPTSNSEYSDYKGKILRFNLDGSIPTDNPTLNGVKSHVYTYGHRNAQGIVFGSNGKLYSSEHGPKTDDELNIIEAGKNYGWPEIAGYYDNNGYGYCNWSSTPGGCNSNGFSDHNCPNNVTKMTENMSYPSGAPVDFQAPIGTFDSTTSSEPSGGYLSWPTVGPSSIDIYESGLIPDWGTSLFIPTLKRGTIFRTQLNASGTALENGTYEEFHSSNDRYRDIAFDPDGITMYAITDNSGGTSGPSGTSGVSIENPGVVMKIQFVGETLSTSQITANDFHFNMIPNPASNRFKMVFNTTSFSQVNAHIIDVQGRHIKQLKNLNSNSYVDISGLSDGMYFIKIYDKTFTEIGNKKLIINK